MFRMPGPDEKREKLRSTNISSILTSDAIPQL